MKEHKNTTCTFLLKIDTYIKSHTLKCIVICYAAVSIIVLFCALAIGAVNLLLFSTNYYSTLNLNINSFDHIGIEVVNENTIITTTNDSQLILNDAKNIKSLHINARYSQLPGEVNLFYAQNANDDFSSNKMLYAQYKDGYYTFNLPLGTKKIRFDCGVHSDVTIEFGDIILNRATFFDLVPINTSMLFIILILPLFLLTFTDILASLIINKKNKA